MTPYQAKRILEEEMPILDDTDHWHMAFSSAQPTIQWFDLLQEIDRITLSSNFAGASIGYQTRRRWFERFAELEMAP